jgi:hypothetical protein
MHIEYCRESTTNRNLYRTQIEKSSINHFWQGLRNHFPELQKKLLQISCHFQLPIHEKEDIILVGKPHAEIDLTWNVTRDCIFFQWYLISKLCTSQNKH